MKSTLYAVLAAALLALPMTAKAVVIEDTFSGSTLDPMWSWEQSAQGGSWYMSGTDWRAPDAGDVAYAHLQTPIVVPAAGARADIVARQYWGSASWGMAVGIYFDHQNFIAVKQGAANGQSGWFKYGFVNGVNVYSQLEAGPDLYSYFLVSGVEITATQVNFYGSSINPLADHWGETGATALASEHLLGTMVRPASFVGNALVIVGRGYETDASYALNPDWDNALGSTYFGWNMIDYVRIEIIPEPATICLLVGGALGLLRRKA